MPAKSSSDVSVVVTIEAERLADASAIANQLSSIGLNNTNILPSIGVITGTCDHSVMMKLIGVSGVVSVEQSGNVQIAPPEFDVQ